MNIDVTTGTGRNGIMSVGAVLLKHPLLCIAVPLAGKRLLHGSTIATTARVRERKEWRGV